MKKIIAIAVLMLSFITITPTIADAQQDRNKLRVNVQIGSQDRDYRRQNRRSRDYRRDNQYDYPTRESYFTRIEIYRGNVYRTVYGVRYNRNRQSIVRLISRVRVR